MYHSYFKSAPHVGLDPFLRLHLADVGLGRLLCHVPVLLADTDDDVVDIFGHHLGIPADVEMRPVGQHLPDLLAALLQPVRDVHLLRLVPAEGRVESEEALLLPLLQLLPVDEVLLLVPTAKVENCRPDRLSLVPASARYRSRNLT